MKISIGCIVEGHGDEKAVPIVIRRIASDLDPSIVVDIPPPLRVPKTKLVKTELGELERSVEIMANKLRDKRAIVVLIDSDKDCPAELGPSLLERAKKARSDLFIAVVLAKMEFEAWFIAAAESLRGHRGLPMNLESPPDPEAIGDAKGWLERRMEGGRKYSETIDQPALSAIFDFEQTQKKSDSFDKCYREITNLFMELS